MSVAVARARILTFLLAAVLVRAAEASGVETALTNVAQVRSLSPEEAGRAMPVRLRGIVIRESSPRERNVFFADESGCIYVNANSNLFSAIRRGDVAEIEGVSDPGRFAPMVIATAAKRIGPGNIPAPRRASYQQIITGGLDAQWVEVCGVVRRIESGESPGNVRRLFIAADGGLVVARGEFADDPRVQVDSEVCVQAICLYQFNQKRQALTPILMVEAPAGLRVINPAPVNPFNAPLRTAESLLQFSPDAPSGHRVRVRGVVTHSQPGARLWIRDHTSGLRIQAQQQENVKAGDEVDVIGFPTYGSFSPMLEDATFRKTGTVQPPVPHFLTNATAAFDHEDDLVAIEATLSQIQPVLEGLALSFTKEGTGFQGVLRLDRSEQPTDWQEGSRVRVTGICSVLHDEARPLWGMWQPQAFQILLRSPTDLTILNPPSWWTPKRITNLLALASGALLLAIGGLMLVSRRRLLEQARRRQMAEAEFAAILSERNRVAREIHDTLAQGLTATSVQLRLAKKQGAGNGDSLNQCLDTAQQLVSDSLEEARNSIWNMRSQVLETDDLPAALDGILKQMADGTELKAALEVTGRRRRFAPVIENNLLRVGQEAITNATRHARAKELKVFLDFGEKQFRLSVRDDGSGFDPADPPRSEGGFGLVGMRQRAIELKGELEVRSETGKGTEITLLMPLSGD